MVDSHPRIVYRRRGDGRKRDRWVPAEPPVVVMGFDGGGTAMVGGVSHFHVMHLGSSEADCGIAGLWDCGIE